MIIHQIHEHLLDWDFNQIFYNNAYLKLGCDKYEIGASEAPVLITLSNKSKFAYLTISRKTVKLEGSGFISLETQVSFSEDYQLEKIKNYSSSIVIDMSSKTMFGPSKVMSIVEAVHKIKHQRICPAISIAFRNGKSLLVRENDLPDGLIVEYNPNNWLSAILLSTGI